MAENRQEQMKEITERLEQGVKGLFTSEMYTEYLKTMSQFHNYSFNNTLLIAMQKPGATLVAGYQAWQKKFERHVKRGEKGIQIIAPAPIKEKQEMEKIDPETQKPVLRSDGQAETEEVEVVIPRFRVTTVFDVSQTEGKPLPEIDAPELMGSVENFENFMESIKTVSPVPIRFAEMDPDTKGYYHQIDKEIVIQEGMSQSQTMKTAVHEVTHAMLHDRELMKESGEWKDQMTREVEAESVAYSVCQYFGLDTSDYSFPYIAGWSSNVDMKELRASMDTIRKTAGEFIDTMTETMQNLMKETNIDRSKEELLLNGTENRYGIYQIDHDGKGQEYLFMNMDFVNGRGLTVDHSDYKLIYSEALKESDTLDSLYEKFNRNHPADFTGHSLSVSDVVVLRHDGHINSYYVDSFGFTEIPEFIRQNEKEQTMEAANENTDSKLGIQQPDAAEPQIYKALKVSDIPVYRHSGTFAREHMEAHWYRMSMRTNIACKEAIETAISKNFDGMHLKHDVENPVLKEFGQERVEYVLANTIQRLVGDGRFSAQNKKWAQTVTIGEDVDGFGGDRNKEFIVNSHPAVLDGFIGLARKAIREMDVEKERLSDEGIEKELSTPDKAEQVVEGAEAKISFYVAECMDVPVLGEFHDNLSLDEAIERYNSIPAGRMNGVKGIGFSLEDGSIYDGDFELMSGGQILKDIINNIPHYKESPLVQKAITDIEVYFSRQEKKLPKVAETDKDISKGKGKKQSVLKALRERQTKWKAQKQEGQQEKMQIKKKGDQEL